MQHPRSSDFAQAAFLERTATPPLRRPQLRRASKALLWLTSLPARFFAYRREMALLGGMDDRELADIGLRRQDLRDATSLPLGEMPGAFLQRRVSERKRPL
ncbi:DUF1127 domain-containing protein [Hyphomicrobiales bacterium BP6-180914]|uniref:DUF1127 domain-containing protein n=2 Tax=Lichenifustis flavocetrariae TaxID=2949735 RepID=A0AA42CJH4_9HYPH|nr:DUF1127 domain-containing protein [Lichenifustis flavocetrariae]